MIATGECDVGLANHYYLGRILKDDADFPVAPAWPDQDGAGRARQRLGRRRRRGLEARPDAVALMEFLTSPAALRKRSSRAASSPRTPRCPRPHTSRAGPTSSSDPIDGEHAGPLLADAVALMHRSAGSSRRRARRRPAGGRGWAVLGLLVALARRRPAGRAAAELRSAGGFGPTPLTLLPPRRCAPQPGARRSASPSGTLVLGGALAVLVSFYDFPGRRAARLGARAAAGDAGLRARVRAARPVRRGQPAAAAACSHGLDAARARAGRARRDRRADAVLYPYVYLLGPQRVPRASRARRSRPPARSGRATAGAVVRGRAAAGPARARRRRGARGDGGAGRLRRGQPAGLPAR